MAREATEVDSGKDLHPHSMHVYCQAYSKRTWVLSISGELDAFMHSVGRLGAGGLFSFLNNDSRRFLLIETKEQLAIALSEMGDIISIRMLTNRFRRALRVLHHQSETGVYG